MGKENSYSRMLSEMNFVQFYEAMSLPVRGLIHSIKFNTIPFESILLSSSTLFLFHATKLDLLILGMQFGEIFNPISGFGKFIKISVYLVFPFIVWGLYEGAKIQRLKKRIEESLAIAGLRNVFGKVPAIVGIYPVDKETTKLVLNRSSYAVGDFVKARDRIESGLNSYIDDIRESRLKGTVEIIYSSLTLPTKVSFRDPELLDSKSFFVGATRSKEVTGDLDSTPHLLVAGQTGGGKSTFLRNLITTFYVNSKNTKFTLIDLKGGLEFQLFEDLPRVSVIPNIERAIEELNSLQKELIRRMEILKKNKVKDIANINENSSEGTFLRSRRLVVVDEIAELFLAGGGADSSKIIQARRILSLIARQGRAVGINLIVATQRPDSKSLDPQVKANLVGVICFQMQNDSSSISVLGNGRATDLPSIPGRAIWKEGPKMTEIQTPLLSTQEAEALIEKFKVSNSPTLEMSSK